MFFRLVYFFFKFGFVIGREVQAEVKFGQKSRSTEKVELMRNRRFWKTVFIRGNRFPKTNLHPLPYKRTGDI